MGKIKISFSQGWYTAKSSSTSTLVAHLLAESSLIYSMTPQNVLRTSDSFAQEKQELHQFLESPLPTREANSTESFQALWPKVETSQEAMELVESPSMEKSSLTRTSTASTLERESSQWQMLDQTPMDLNSSFASTHSHIWMENTQSLEKLLKVPKSLTKWKQLEVKPELPQRMLSLKIAAN